MMTANNTNTTSATARNANGNGNASGTAGAGAGARMGSRSRLITSRRNNANGTGTRGSSSIFTRDPIDLSGRPISEVLLLKTSIAAGGSGGAAVLFESKAIHHEAIARKFRRRRATLQKAIKEYSETVQSLSTGAIGDGVRFSHDIEAEIASCELLERHHRAEADQASRKQMEYAAQAKVWADIAEELRVIRKKKEFEKFVKYWLIPTAVCLLLAGIISALKDIV